MIKTKKFLKNFVKKRGNFHEEEKTKMENLDHVVENFEILTLQHYQAPKSTNPSRNRIASNEEPRGSQKTLDGSHTYLYESNETYAYTIIFPC